MYTGQAPMGVYTPQTLQNLSHFFCCRYSQNVMNLHQLFNISVNTHLTCFSKNKACMGVKYLLVCIRKYESNLPINICTTVGKKTQWYTKKMWHFKWKRTPTLLYDSMVSFLLPKCMFFTSGVYQIFYHNFMFLWFL